MEGQTVELRSAEFIATGATDLIILYSAHAKEAGIDIKPIREPNDGYWSEVWLKKPWMMSNWCTSDAGCDVYLAPQVWCRLEREFLGKWPLQRAAHHGQGRVGQQQACRNLS